MFYPKNKSKEFAMNDEEEMTGYIIRATTMVDSQSK
jgi:hypothetical protein